MRALIAAVTLLLAGPAGAETHVFPAPVPDGTPDLVIYSTLDAPLAAPLIAAFQGENPGVGVRYEDLLTGAVTDRVIAETDAGGPTADLTFSSAMDLQVKLANDGYAQAVTLPAAAVWPRWANWRDTAYAVTSEPAVLVYHRPSFPGGPPDTRVGLIRWLDELPSGQGGPARVGTYDIARSGVGYLFLARDIEHFPDIWSLVRAMARAGLETHPTSAEIIERVADGRLMLGYNILGSYAADQARSRPDLGLVLMRDHTVAISRVALVPRAAARPDLGARFLGFLLSPAGQRLLSEGLRLPAIRLDVAHADSAGAMQAVLGDTLRPVPVSPGLLAYLDQAKRRRLLALWAAAVGE